MARPMTDEETRAFLSAGTRTGKVATVRSNGRPHVAPIWFVLDTVDDQDYVIFNTGEDYQRISGWEGALDNCPDMAASRRDYLKEQLSLLTRHPAAYVTATGRLRTRRPQWL